MRSRCYFLTLEQAFDNDRFILFADDRVLVREDKLLWHKDEVKSHLLPDVECLVLGDEYHSVVVAHTDQRAVAVLGAESRSLRSLLFGPGEIPFAMAGKAGQLLEWYRSHRFCGTCGSPTQAHQSERALHCSHCQRHYYPRINPCVIVLVVRGREMLLARSARYKSGFFSCLAGFIEVGESAEQTIHREVKEEVGVEVENIRYFKSQSWPFPSQLMLAYFADYKTGQIVPEPEEIEVADWFDVNDLPQVPSADVSVAGELIQHHVGVHSS